MATSTPSGVKYRDPSQNCSICLDEIVHPQILPCHHVFCLICINDHGQYFKPDHTLPCPLCRTRVSYSDIQPLRKIVSVTENPEKKKMIMMKQKPNQESQQARLRCQAMEIKQCKKLEVKQDFHKEKPKHKEENQDDSAPHNKYRPIMTENISQIHTASDKMITEKRSNLEIQRLQMQGSYHQNNFKKCLSVSDSLFQMPVGSDSTGIEEMDNITEHDDTCSIFPIMDCQVLKQKPFLAFSFNAKLRDDTKDCCLTGIDADKQHLYITDTKFNSSTGNQKIKIFSPKGHLQSSITANDPTDVAVLGNGNLCVVNYSEKTIQLFNIQQKKTTGYCQGKMQVPYSVSKNREGNILVCDRKMRCIFIFDSHNRKFQKRISLPMCLTPVYCAVDANNDNLLISDYSAHCVYLLTPGGQDIIFQYGILGKPGADDRQLNSPCGICFDDLGYIFIADTWNHRVLMINQNGKLVKYISTKEDGMTLPRAMTVWPRTGMLTVAEQDGSIKIYQYL